MTETGLVGREPAVSDVVVVDRQANVVALEIAIRRIVERDPESARRLLDVLRNPERARRHRPVIDTLSAMGTLTSVVMEVLAPTPLRLQPARLGDAWASVGQYLRHGIREMGNRLEHHG